MKTRDFQRLKCYYFFLNTKRVIDPSLFSDLGMNFLLV